MFEEDLLKEPATMSPELAQAYGLPFDQDAALRATVSGEELLNAFRAKYDNDWTPGWGPHAMTFLKTVEFVVATVVERYKRVLNEHLN